jgi:hypothetical protein
VEDMKKELVELVEQYADLEVTKEAFEMFKQMNTKQNRIRQVLEKLATNSPSRPAFFDESYLRPIEERKHFLNGCYGLPTEKMPWELCCLWKNFVVADDEHQSEEKS